MEKVVYIAGPFRAQDAKHVRNNVRRAYRWGLYAAKLGCRPFIPHTMYGDFSGQIPEERMVEMTRAWLPSCNALLCCVPIDRAPASDGTWGEVLDARRLHIPAFFADEMDGKIGCNDFEEWVASTGDPAAVPGEITLRACDYLAGIAQLLRAKNAAYGDSIGQPLGIFSRATSAERIRSRIDDKLSRITRGDGSGNEDAVADLIGYLALLHAVETP